MFARLSTAGDIYGRLCSKLFFSDLGQTFGHLVRAHIFHKEYHMCWFHMELKWAIDLIRVSQFQAFSSSMRGGKKETKRIKIFWNFGPP